MQMNEIGLLYCYTLILTSSFLRRTSFSTTLSYFMLFLSFLGSISVFLVLECKLDYDTLIWSLHHTYSVHMSYLVQNIFWNKLHLAISKPARTFFLVFSIFIGPDRQKTNETKNCFWRGKIKESLKLVWFLSINFPNSMGLKISKARSKSLFLKWSFILPSYRYL